MMRSFKNKIKRFWFAVRSDPLAAVLLITSFPVFLLYFSGWLSIVVTLWLGLSYLIFVTLYFLFRSFHQKRLTKCFVMVSYFGNSYVYQNCKKDKIKKLKHNNNCTELLKDEISRLIASLPSGKFVAVTHDYVIDILQRSGEFEITHMKFAYMQNLVKLQRKMFDCKKCPKHTKSECKLRKSVKEPRQFYYIKFEKREGQPNPTR